MSSVHVGPNPDLDPYGSIFKWISGYGPVIQDMDGSGHHTDKKENQIFLIYKEIHT